MVGVNGRCEREVSDLEDGIAHFGQPNVRRGAVVGHHLGPNEGVAQFGGANAISHLAHAAHSVAVVKAHRALEWRGWELYASRGLVSRGLAPSWAAQRS